MRPIDGEELKKHIESTICYGCETGHMISPRGRCYVNTVLMYIDDMPEVDAQTVKRGERIFQGRRDENGRNIYRCSECNFEVKVFPCNLVSWRTHEKYCPGCGARMDGGSE